ncbi:uncharacterized protein LOC144108747 [Amblyomma americanum]
MAARGFPNQIPEFNGSSWSLWVGRLQFYFEANNITDLALKRANLLTLCGEQTCDTVSALIQPSTPAAVSYDDIVAALQKHYDPRPSEVYSRARFQRRDQLERETASAYIAALKKLAAHCDFGTLTTTGTRQERDAASSANTTMPPLDVMLRDRFVSGLSDESLQQRMFSEKDLTFNKAYDIAVRADSAGHQQREMRRNTEPVHQTSNQTPSQDVVEQLQGKYETVFSEEIPGNEGPLVTLELLGNAQSKFLKARPVPFALRASAEKELGKLEQQGPIEGCTFLVVVDAYTKWLEIREMKQTTSAAVVDNLRSLFTTFGLPGKVVSDNRTPFVSAEILKFYRDSEISSVTSAPYHPATNGQAERTWPS